MRLKATVSKRVKCFPVQSFKSWCQAGISFCLSACFSLWEEEKNPTIPFWHHNCLWTYVLLIPIRQIAVNLEWNLLCTYNAMSCLKGSANTLCEPSDERPPQIEISSNSPGLHSSSRQPGHRGVDGNSHCRRMNVGSFSILFWFPLPCPAKLL